MMLREWTKDTEQNGTRDMQKDFLFSHEKRKQWKKLEYMEFSTIYEHTYSNNSSKKTRKVSGRPELEQFHHHSPGCLYKKKFLFSIHKIAWTGLSATSSSLWFVVIIQIYDTHLDLLSLSPAERTNSELSVVKSLWFSAWWDITKLLSNSLLLQAFYLIWVWAFSSLKVHYFGDVNWSVKHQMYDDASWQPQLPSWWTANANPFSRERRKRSQVNDHKPSSVLLRREKVFCWWEKQHGEKEIMNK